MTIRKTLGAMVSAGAMLLMTGCGGSVSGNYKEGIVEKEYGTVAQIVESSGAMLGNESVRIGNPTYILQIRTPEGVYTASVFPKDNRTLEALSIALQEGDRVRFRTNRPLDGNLFGRDRIGTIYASEIEILPKE